jgi:hypothetical protein
MPTITDREVQLSKPTHRVVLGVLALFSGVVTLALVALFILLAEKATGPAADRSIAGLILSLVGSFAVFFAVISVQGTTSAVKPRRELMSLVAWRLLYTTLVLIGIGCAIAFHWFAIVLPLAMALICLLREPKVQEWLRALGI